MLVQEPGPGRVFVKVREATGIQHDKDDKVVSHGDWTPLYCVWCTSLWVAPLLMLAPKPIVKWLAISAAAIIVHEKLSEV